MIINLIFKIFYMNSLRQIQKVSVGDFRNALIGLETGEAKSDLDFADIVYLAQIVFADDLTTQEKQKLVNVALQRESSMKYAVVGCWAKNPYLLKKNIELAQLYFSNDIYADYWESIWKRLYQTLVQLYGHDLYSIQKVPICEVRSEILKLKGLTDAQLKKWIKDNYPENNRRIFVSYFLDELDLWYLVNHHPQKNEVSESEYRFLADYVHSNYAMLFEGMLGCDYDNEYQVKKRYLFTLSVGDEKTARVYRMTLKNVFQEKLPNQDNFELYLKRLNN